MSLHRIYAVILRHYYITRHSVEMMLEMFYWPAMDLFIWGLTGTYFQHYSSSSKIILMIISGVVLWEVIWRGQSEVSRTLLEELWNKNLVNMFVSPLTFSEWILSIIIVGLIKSSISFIFAALLANILFKVNILLYGGYLLFFVLFLAMLAWSIGFFLCGLVLRYSTKVQGIVFGAMVIAAPFSAIYYPLSHLPVWAQKVALFLPTSYIFEGAREFVQKGYVSPDKIIVCFLLNCFYLILSVIYLKKCFNSVLQKGLLKAG